MPFPVSETDISTLSLYALGDYCLKHKFIPLVFYFTAYLAGDLL